MKWYILLIVSFGLKVLYDFCVWMYGYYLRIKWVSYFNKNNINYIKYNYQLEKYFLDTPSCECYSDLFDKDNVNVIKIEFIKSHGYYKHKFFQNFNPFYWINFVLFLPQNIIYYLGFKRKSKSIKLLNIIWWIFSIIFAIYQNEITTFIKELIKSLIEKITN